MAYKQLTEEGKKFIRNACSAPGNTMLRGKSKIKITDPEKRYYNPDGVLPFCSPETSPTKTWISYAKYNGKVLTTNSEVAEAIINWYNKYGKIYEMDANVMAAQAYQESKYVFWAYPLTSTASGISQFLAISVLDVIIQNNYSSIKPLFTQAEIEAITKDVSGNKLVYSTYDVGTKLGKENRPIMHQNIIDNPEIMIKAQFRYMKYIASRCNGLTSSTLFGYSRGPAYAKSSYTASINHCMANEKPKYEEEGIDYVYKIFNYLGNKSFPGLNGHYFGYDFLNMTSETPFDSQTAKAIDSNIRYA